MSEYQGYQLIEHIAFTVKSVTPRGNVLRIDYGGGYSDKANVGLPTKSFTCTSGVWPDEAHVGELDAKTWFRYYYEFFEERIANANEAFIIQWDGKYWLVELADPEYSFERFKASNIYTPQTFTLNSVRARGITFNADGSLLVDEDPPTLGDGFEVVDEGPGYVELEWDAASD